jgi:hypothetical protein
MQLVVMQLVVMQLVVMQLGRLLLRAKRLWKV